MCTISIVLNEKGLKESLRVKSRYKMLGFAGALNLRSEQWIQSDGDPLVITQAARRATGVSIKRRAQVRSRLSSSRRVSRPRASVSVRSRGLYAETGHNGTCDRMRTSAERMELDQGSINILYEDQ